MGSADQEALKIVVKALLDALASADRLDPHKWDWRLDETAQAIRRKGGSPTVDMALEELIKALGFYRFDDIAPHPGIREGGEAD